MRQPSALRRDLAIAEMAAEAAGELVGRMRQELDARMAGLETSLKALAVPGPQGPTGARGEKGAQGEPGQAGAAGEPGIQGERGKDGRDAEPWRHRYAYELTGVYSKGDVVALNGSSWLALADDPGELPGDGWTLIAKAGSRGEKGERGHKGFDGEKGDKGPEGPPGTIIIAARIENWSLVFDRDDGETMRVDLYPLFARYQRETA